MERSELLSSAASGSYGLTQTENDDTLSEGCSEDTLNLVESAILRTLKKHSSHTPERYLEESTMVGGARLRGRSNNARDEEQHSAASESAPPAKSSNPEDMKLLANLLEQVHDLRRNQRQGSRKPKEMPPPEAQDIGKPARRRGREKKSSSSSEELRMTLEAAAMAAKAAADAAEAAAVSVAKNTEAIEFIMNSMKSSKKRRKSKSVTASDEEAIVKSNQRTHWILGFMAITTIAWRFGVVKVAKRISGKLNDPFGYVGSLMGSNDDPAKENVEKLSEKHNFLDKLPHIDMPEFLPNDADHKTNDKETKANFLDNLPRIDMPEFLPNDADHKTNGKETKVKETKAKETKETKAKETSLSAKSAAAVDVKTKAGEKTAFSFANLLQTKPKKT